MSTIPSDYWRDVPCGHPHDPVAMRNDDGHPVCHCGYMLDVVDAISDGSDEEAPGPIVPCRRCGCYVSVSANGEQRSYFFASIVRVEAGSYGEAEALARSHVTVAGTNPERVAFELGECIADEPIERAS